VGACFDVTVLAWRKYATILMTHEHARLRAGMKLSIVTTSLLEILKNLAVMYQRFEGTLYIFVIFLSISKNDWGTLVSRINVENAVADG
jgi:hypothetical protein